MSTTEVKFGFTVARSDSTVIVAITGELDVATVPALRHAVTDLVHDQGNLSIVLDLAAVTFLDSTALGFMVGVHRDLKQRGGRFAVWNPTRSAVRVFEISGIDRTIEISQT